MSDRIPMWDKPFPILISYAYLRDIDEAYIKWVFTRPWLTVLLDSGAFTAHNSGNPIDIDDYIAFLDDWKHVIKDYMALDVINNPKQSRSNIKKMWKAGLEPIPVFVTGEREAWMNELYEHKDIVAIPLSAPVSSNMSARRKFMQVRMKWAAGRKVHWFGFTDQKSLVKYQPHSCDSSSWLTSVRYGRMDIYLGRGRWCHATRKGCQTSVKMLSQAQRAVELLGHDPALVLDETYWARNVRNGIPTSYNLPFQVTVHSMIRYVIDVFERFGTKQYLSGCPGTGIGGGVSGDFYWVFKQLRGYNIPSITKQPKWDFYKV